MNLTFAPLNLIVFQTYTGCLTENHYYVVFDGQNGHGYYHYQES